VRLFAKRGPYVGSTEELTPVRCDRISAVPLAHHLDLKSIRLIEREEFG
jgi:hypothetical protein